MRLLRRFSLAVLALPLLLLAGCDSSEDDLVGLTYDYEDENSNRLIQFQFSSNDVSQGQRREIGVPATIDLSSFVRDRVAASRQDITSAKVSNIEFEVTLPPTVNANFLSEVVLFVDSDNFSALEIASQTSFPSDNDTFTLNLRDREFSDYASDTGFEFRLQYVPRTLQPNTTYSLTVIDLKLRLEVAL